MDAHVELDRRAAKHQRQTRVLFLLRKLLDRNAAGMEPTRAGGGDRPHRGRGVRRRALLAAAGGRARRPSATCAWAPPSACRPRWTRARCACPLGSGIAGEVARTRMPTSWSATRRTSAGGSLVGDDWYTSDAFVSLPLVSRGRLLGVLNLTNFRAGTVDDTEVEQLRLVALCVALLADHAGLSERLFDPRRVLILSP